jgi:hypothetical protein
MQRPKPHDGEPDSRRVRMILARSAS